MTSTAIAGTRCRANRAFQDKSGRIERLTEGRVCYVSENVGRILFTVEWDQGGRSVVFADEIELIDPNLRAA